MWMGCVIVKKKHDKRPGGQYGVAYIRGKAQLGVVWIGEACAGQWRKATCAISRYNHNLSCGSCMLLLTTHLDKKQCNIGKQAGWQLTPSS